MMTKSVMKVNELLGKVVKVTKTFLLEDPTGTGNATGRLGTLTPTLSLRKRGD
jgi:hypothetical protein